ncbi:histidine kinase [Actinacidiphila bryophytorum]|uniref:histidine kinase n=1 Tax=Actinacidiphila bryophytorum TaxID=1436133 RepID=A0A9W4H6M0_9ACTN|nr:histidine kinase [Actinacidiphila bryophytorum]MBM9436812.1 sensor histidine kinase [Actinacidiphila bryophytorum]MBN6542345.1 sensor histidine kinase [Actinacidiphila bryophytorum]CAG7654413.1 putative two component system sensor kinase [Actinacidiphila bryophytorum]
MSMWTTWPSREALDREGRSAGRQVVGRGIRAILLGVAVWAITTRTHLPGWQTALALIGLVAAAGAVWLFFRLTLRHLLWPSLAVVLALLGGAVACQALGATVAASVLMCGSAMISIQRLPLAAGAPLAGAALLDFALMGRGDGWLVSLLTVLGLCLLGYTARLDAEARGNTQRLLVQERAARAAEAETAALAERARIAREIHDVLAHSLSAQTVHLEATRLLIERGADRDLVLERVVAARRMAREGLAETRQALSALRGDMSPVEEFLRELVSSEGARLEVRGKPRGLPAEAGLAVRRVAQEAMTNVRKHAPGARVELRLEYRPAEVELEFRDFGGQGAVDNSLGESGSGYGLLGMRERAELLGGALDAGPVEEGFVVRLRVPA